MNEVPNPCRKDCPDRTPTCHGTCDRYAQFAAWREEVRKAKIQHQAEKVAGPGLKKALRKKRWRERQGRK